MSIYRACFTLIYAYGLRISEAVTLPVSAVDSKQMVLHVIGKGNLASRIRVSAAVGLRAKDCGPGGRLFRVGRRRHPGCGCWSWRPNMPLVPVKWGQAHVEPIP
jgi:hypothetical protein